MPIIRKIQPRRGAAERPADAGRRSVIEARGLLATILTVCALRAGLAPAATAGTDLHRLYDGEPRPPEAVARLWVPPSLEVRSLDGRGLAAPLSGILEILPGPHSLRANPTTPPRDGIRFFKSNEVAFEAAAGGNYGLSGAGDDLGWIPRVGPAEDTSGPIREPARAVCWLASVTGAVVATEIRGLRVKRVTLQVDGEPSSRTWDYLAPALVPPGGLVRGFASGWSRDGTFWGYDVGARAALKPGQRLRAAFSECEPTTLIEFILPDGVRPTS